jgi:undecaprenyl-diphosphatase
VLIAGALILMGTLLALADWMSKGDKTIAELSIGMAIGIGLAQSFALIPGVSRSGVTITTALFLGLNRRDAAKFSFLMSIPIIAGAGVLKCKAILHSPDKMALGAGFLASAVAGLFAIWLLFKIIQTKRYTPFVVYRWALGLFVLMNLPHFG